MTLPFNALVYRSHRTALVEAAEGRGHGGAGGVGGGGLRSGFNTKAPRL